MNSWILPHRRIPTIALGLLLGVAIAVLVACSQGQREKAAQPTAPVPLQIYWNRGFYPAEDQALQQVIDDWEQQSQVPVKLSLFSSDDILNQTTIALDKGTPPDIVFAHRADYTITPRWAAEGKLADVSEVITPVKDQYTETALASAYLNNQKKKNLGYYAVPIEQQMLHVHYWRDLLNQAGFTDADIPSDWSGFWQFWQQVQDRLRQQGNNEVYGLGIPVSSKAGDSFFIFEQILEANHVALFDAQGKLQLREPRVKQGLIDAIAWLTQLYQQGYVPLDATNWLDSDNNVKFLNQNFVMTLNPSLSIPASQREETDLYTQKIATRGLPNNPDGQPPRYLVSIKQALVFDGTANLQAAKDFLTYLIQPERLNTYIKSSLGRWFPVTPNALKDAYWKDSTDPHLTVAIQQFQQKTRPFYQVQHPPYAQVQAENVWGQALGWVIQDKQSPEAAVDRAIARIEQIFAEWGN
ncbi:MAG: ABC transporter substrate-binding protein [Oculatellaceae cyanobacterium Prado106]|jgi:multiple sugar transport system substrate-binding protein|nr:ABC transporter substrate-binding protein [Oculatellaceae cyanobacterium Prado106]